MKIRSINTIHLTEPVPVYDISVPGTENFALAAGPFVHNSKDTADAVAGVIASLEEYSLRVPHQIEVLGDKAEDDDQWERDIIRPVKSPRAPFKHIETGIKEHMKGIGVGGHIVERGANNGSHPEPQAPAPATPTALPIQPVKPKHKELTDAGTRTKIGTGNNNSGLDADGLPPLPFLAY